MLILNISSVSFPYLNQEGDRTMLILNYLLIDAYQLSIAEGDRTMLILNPGVPPRLEQIRFEGDRTMLILNIIIIIRFVICSIEGDRTMLILNKCNTLVKEHIMQRRPYNVNT